jgi:hypothetical protein
VGTSISGRRWRQRGLQLSLAKTMLLPEFRQNGGRYFNTDERDFVAVYSR